MISENLIKLWLLPLTVTSLSPLLCALPYEWSFKSKGNRNGSKKTVMIKISKYYEFYLFWTSLAICAKVISCLYMSCFLVICEHDVFQQEVYPSINMMSFFFFTSVIQIWSMFNFK